MPYQTDCRFFSGYKPCDKNETCDAGCPSKQKATPRILIVHLDAMGAVLRATAILPAIKRKWPQSFITWVTSPASFPLLENNPHIDQLLKSDTEGSLILSGMSFDLSFCIDKSLKAVGLTALPMNIKEKMGFGVSAENNIIPLNPQAQRLYEIGLSNTEKFYQNKLSEIQLITEALGLKYEKDEYVYRMTPDELAMREEYRRKWELTDVTTPIIGLNTGCSPTIPYKKLTVGGWVQLIDVLHLRYPDAKFVLLGGGQEDKERNQSIQNLCRHEIINTPCGMGARMGAVFMDLCDSVVTGDSLGMHMAIALKKWTVSWFGPTCAHEIEFYNRGEPIQTMAPCSPCWKRSCNKTKMCYDMVPWGKVVEAVERGLKKIKKSRPAPQHILPSMEAP